MTFLPVPKMTLKVYISRRVLRFQFPVNLAVSHVTKWLSGALVWQYEIHKFMKIYTLWRTFKRPLGKETFQKISLVELVTKILVHLDMILIKPTKGRV